MGNFLSRKAVWDLPVIHITSFHTNDMLDGETEDQFIDRYIAKLKLNPVYKSATYTLVDDTKIPKDKTHRNEWKLENGEVKPDQVKVQAKLDKIAADQAKEDALIAKLKITKEDFEIIKKKVS